MDLKDVITSVTDKVTEANNAYHAGHPETSILYFKNIMEEIRAYFEQLSPDEVDALAAITSEQAAEESNQATPEVPSEQAQPAAGAVKFLGENVGQVIPGQKPNQ